MMTKAEEAQARESIRQLRAQLAAGLYPAAWAAVDRKYPVSVELVIVTDS